MNPEAGKWCVIAGAAGALGHLAIQYAKQMGLKVLGIDGHGLGKENFCMKMGADAFVDFTTEDFVESVLARTDGGADYILVLSPHQSAYEYVVPPICGCKSLTSLSCSAAGQYANFKAQIMAVGIGNSCMSLRPILKKDLIIRSNETGTKADMQSALDICAQGKVVPEVEMVELGDINAALDRVKSGQVMGKLILDLGSEKVD
ncbi:hypothetical protein LTR10_011752 [Elasticomyces elasticus]|uniref:Alcohol dehydrogenase-like C-terminal domain-containing protein n=1 Tax=Exophiala sideris TaxID=1016849 RepID=A0ABR0JDE0_9EURO|nr:hypothetical protein LTR10_011752 [Elasticomyces elasticus]KAK5061947.1 hypothetical protein LTR69_005131 [Exophiala sideris]KAK5184647.1 hypothetical protein LTR44_003322 [Eurotiomycetes sp. CCFEE 6388]